MDYMIRTLHIPWREVPRGFRYIPLGSFHSFLIRCCRMDYGISGNWCLICRSARSKQMQRSQRKQSQIDSEMNLPNCFFHLHKKLKFRQSKIRSHLKDRCGEFLCRQMSGGLMFSGTDGRRSCQRRQKSRSIPA